jgi:hypothetical protein
MRFFATLLVASAAALVSAQTTTTTGPASTTVSIDPSQTSVQAEILKCLDACNPGDVACTSKCIAVPNPNASQVNQTNQCITDCPKGNGTAADNLNYENCREGCIGKYYFSASGGTPQATTTGAGGSSANPTGSTTGSVSGSGTAAGGSTTSTSKGGADVVHVAGSAAGLLGFVAALLAL